ncbi:class I SAM-dependent methyltransferase [Gracilimonas sp.]|uniref:class I SAM-dependent methyltransferase n=1 Tax=Gracilimonas sp. TaxID=1974203 RepID=UPI003BAC905F
MPVFLSKRRPNLIEYMDRDDCDPQLLENTYRQFSTINLLLSQWKRIYKNELRPLMHKGKTYSLLDIGFGGGDVPLKLSEWANKDGLELQITAIETDQRAFEFARQLEAPNQVTFQHCSSTDLVSQSRTYDFVISNHVLHHLAEDQLLQVLDEAKSLSLQKVIFNDIERSDIGYFLFANFARLIFRNSFIVPDGLISIKRSYTIKELKQVAPAGWQVQRLFPFRLLLKYDKN